MPRVIGLTEIIHPQVRRPGYTVETKTVKYRVPYTIDCRHRLDKTDEPIKHGESTDCESPSTIYYVSSGKKYS